MAASALQDLELKSISWIGLDSTTDLDIIPQLARTQHNSLQDLQLIFTAPQFSHIPGNKASSSWHPHDIEHPFPVFQKLRSLSLAGLNLWGVSPDFVEKLNLANVYHLRIIDCDGVCDLVKSFADNEQPVPRLISLEIELFNHCSEGKSVVPFPKILRRFTTLEDFRLSFGRYLDGAIPHIVEAVSQHLDLRRFLWDGDFDANARIPPPYHHHMSFLNLCTSKECLALSQRIPFIVST